jgi:hypothetical protein
LTINLSEYWLEIRDFEKSAATWWHKDRVPPVRDCAIGDYACRTQRGTLPPIQFHIDNLDEFSPPAVELIDPRELGQGDRGLQLANPVVVPELKMSAAQRVMFLFWSRHSEAEVWYARI